MGYQGGLYPGGTNTKPATYLSKALTQASKIKPRLGNGAVDCAAGKIVMLSIGGSNPASEFSVFRSMALAYPNLNPKLSIVHGGGLGKIPRVFDPTDGFWTNIADNLAAEGVTKSQVQVIWLQTDDVTNGNTVFPDAPLALEDSLVKLCHLLVDSFPNVRICHITARAYAGYAAPDFDEPALEYPRDYYNGWAIKWLIQKQISGDPSLKFTGTGRNSPFLSWATYLWADGATPCDYTGVSWLCPTDFKLVDGFHYSLAGKTKAATELFNFFSTDEVATTWFTDSYSCFDGSRPADREDATTSFAARIYPNPMGAAVQIADVRADDYEVRILDLYGRPAASCRNCSSLETGHLPDGVYVIDIVDGQGAVLLRQVVCK